MKTAIIIFVVLSLLGSIMWVMPTQRQKFQAKLRLKARAEGFLVQLVRLTGPREQGEMEERSFNIPAYRVLRTNLGKGESEKLKTWQVFRMNAIANEGLPQGWSWKLGERTLTDSELALLNEWLPKLPTDVEAVESTPINVTAFWRESEEEDLMKIKAMLQELIKVKM